LYLKQHSGLDVHSATILLPAVNGRKYYWKGWIEMGSILKVIQAQTSTGYDYILEVDEAQNSASELFQEV
jgi:hypothetical protein